MFNDNDKKIDCIKQVLVQNGYDDEFIDDNIYYLSREQGSGTVAGIYIKKSNEVMSSDTGYYFDYDEYIKKPNNRKSKGRLVHKEIGKYIDLLYPKIIHPIFYK